MIKVIRGKLKAVNMLSLLILTMLSIRLIILPRDIIEHAKCDAWISIIVVGIISYISAYIFYSISMKYPKLNFAEISTKVLGAFLGKISILIITIYTMTAIGLFLRLFSESIKTFLLEETPSIVVIIVLICACSYCLIKGIKTISIIYDILLPGVLVIIVTILFMTYKNAEFKNLLPCLHNGFRPVISGSLHAIQPALGCGIISYIMPYFEEAKETKKWINVAVAVAIFVYLLLIIMSLAVLDVMEIQQLNFPTISLAKTIDMREEIFERTESFFMAAWIPNAFTTIVTFYIITTLNIKELFNVKKASGINKIILLQTPFFVTIALLPRNVPKLNEYLILSNKVAAYLNLGYLPVFFLIVLMKGKGAG